RNRAALDHRIAGGIGVVSATHTRVSGVEVTGSYAGISVNDNADDTVIERSSISSNGLRAVCVCGGLEGYAEETVLRDNEIHDSGVGIYCDRGYAATLDGNLFTRV